MKEALGNSKLPNNQTLYRGTTKDALGSLKSLSPDDLIGETFSEPGFLSTSTSSSVGKDFTGDMFMKIHASQGANGLDISSLSYYAESEVLFNAGQTMRIVSAKVQNNVLYIEVVLK